MSKFPGNVARSHENGLIVQHVEITFDSPAQTFKVHVPGGTFAYVVGGVVRVVFDATTPTLTIGDGDDVDGYADNTDLALGTALSVTTPAVKVCEDLGNPYANGKYYPTDDTIDFIWDPGTSGTTGRWLGFVHMSNVKASGISA